MKNIFFLLIILQLSLTKHAVTQGIIVVSDPSQLLVALYNAQQGDTILLEDGTYSIPNNYFEVSTDNIRISSLSGYPETVVVNGDGMNGDDYGFTILSDNVTISNITIQNVRYNCITAYENTDGLYLSNCILRDAGEFFLSISWFDASSPSENGIIENCMFEYSAGNGIHSYMGGINGKFCKDWTIRNNIFRSIRSPQIGNTVYAILFWDDSENILVEKNHIIDCDRGIGFGIGMQGNLGGIIRNNFIYHRNIIDNDQKGILLESSPSTNIYNNTIYFNQDVFSSIEYRFNSTIEIYVANNLTNKPILARDGARGTDTNNVIFAASPWFRNISTGDLHLSSDTLSEVVDQGIAISGLFEDFDSDSRPQGSGVDIGADEYTSSTDIDEFNSKRILPRKVKLTQNYPNPFNPSTTIKFDLPQTSNVTLKIFDILGEEVATIVSDRLTAGSYSYRWSQPAGMASGVYLYRLEAGDPSQSMGQGFVETKKMILMR